MLFYPLSISFGLDVSNSNNIIPIEQKKKKCKRYIYIYGAFVIKRLEIEISKF